MGAKLIIPLNKPPPLRGIEGGCLFLIKINRTKSSAYVEGETAIHKLKAETKIIVALFLLLGSGIGNRWVLMGVGLLSIMGVFVARVPVNELLFLSGAWLGSFWLL